MMGAGAGLTEVGTDELKRALAALHRGQLTCPLTMPELTRVGLQHVSQELLGTFRDLDESAVRAVLVCVLAERDPRNRMRRVKP